MDPLFTFSGLASGLDTSQLVQSLVQVERQPIRRIQSTQDDLRSKRDKFNLLGDDLTALQDAARALDTRAKVLTSKATSSQEDAVGVSAEGGASLGSFAVTVSNVASAQRTYSSGFADSETAGLFGAGDLEITVGTDATVAIPIDANSTLESIAGAINGSGADVTAGILFTGSEYHLQVTGNETGAAHAITFGETGTVSLGMTDTKQSALDANFTVDGFTMSSATNLVTDAIPGVTLNLKDQTSGTETVTIERDTDELAKLLTDFVDAYNEVDRRIAFENRNPGSADNSTLFGDQALRTVQQKLRGTVTDRLDALSGPYNYLASIGVSIDRDGVLSLDRETLDEALADDPEAVARLLMDDPNTGTQGMMSLVDDMVGDLTSTVDGLIPTRTKGIDERIRSLDDQVARMELRIDDYADQLRKQFTAMEMALASLQGQGAQLSAMLGGG